MRMSQNPTKVRVLEGHYKSPKPSQSDDESEDSDFEDDEEDDIPDELHPEHLRLMGRMAGVYWDSVGPDFTPWPPGYENMHVLADRSKEFAKNPDAAIAKLKRKYGTDVFTTRLALRATVILGSNPACVEFFKGFEEEKVGFVYVSRMRDILGKRCFLFPSLPPAPPTPPRPEAVPQKGGKGAKGAKGRKKSAAKAPKPEKAKKDKKGKKSAKVEELLPEVDPDAPPPPPPPTMAQRLAAAIPAEFTIMLEDRIYTDFLPGWVTALPVNKPLDLKAALNAIMSEFVIWLMTNVTKQADAELITKVQQTTEVQHTALLMLCTDFKRPVAKNPALIQAIAAKSTLITMITPFMAYHETGPWMSILTASCADSEESKDQFSTLMSPLMVKCLASILLSLIITSPTWRPPMEDPDWGDFPPEDLDPILFEVLRMFPPLTMGYGVTKTITTMFGCSLGEDQAMIPYLWMGQRDPNVFPSPDNFNPGRWTEQSELAREILFPFTCGTLGKLLGEVFVCTVKAFIGSFGKLYRWEVIDNPDLIQWEKFPVLQPRMPVMVVLKKLPQRAKPLKSM